MVEGLKWVLLVVKIRAHITMGLGNMVPSLIWNTEVVALDGGVHIPMNWAIVANKKLVKDEDVPS